jgi:hypothetical protein
LLPLLLLLLLLCPTPALGGGLMNSFPLFLLPIPRSTGVGAAEAFDDDDEVMPRGDEAARGDDSEVRRSCELCRRLELRTKLFFLGCMTRKIQ